MQKSLSLLIICVLDFCLLSCKKELDVTFDSKAFAYNKKQWEQLNIKNYSFEYQWGGFGFVVPCTIVVRDSKIQELIPNDERYSHLELNPEHYMTIDDIFKEIENTFNNPMYKKYDKNTYWYCHEILVEYDEIYFFPKFVAFNHRGKNMGITDTDYCHRITYFVVE